MIITQNTKTKLLLFISIILVFVLYLLNNQITNFLTIFLAKYGYIAFTISAGLLEGIPQLLSTDLLLFIGAIYNLNTFYTFISIAVGATIGSIIAFYLGKIFGEKIALYFITKQKYTQITDYIKQKGKYALPLISISPLPYFPIVFGAAKVSVFDFVMYGLTIRIIKHAIISYLIVYSIQHNYISLLQQWFGI